jgi:hypothetical protein
MSFDDFFELVVLVLPVLLGAVMVFVPTNRQGSLIVTVFDAARA